MGWQVNQDIFYADAIDLPLLNLPEVRYWV